MLAESANGQECAICHRFCCVIRVGYMPAKMFFFVFGLKEDFMIDEHFKRVKD